MSDVRVRTVQIEAGDDGAAAVCVTYESEAGEELVRRTRGPEATVRAIARDLAERHDLVPLWEDLSWLWNGMARPPASLYRPRRAGPGEPQPAPSH